MCFLWPTENFSNFSILWQAFPNSEILHRNPDFLPLWNKKKNQSICGITFLVSAMQVLKLGPSFLSGSQGLELSVCPTGGCGIAESDSPSPQSSLSCVCPLFCPYRWLGLTVLSCKNCALKRSQAEALPPPLRETSPSFSFFWLILILQTQLWVHLLMKD